MDLGLIEAAEHSNFPPIGARNLSFSDEQRFYHREIRVLLVEDDHVDADLITLMAASTTTYRLNMVRVASSAEAGALLMTQQFDCCILDYWLGCETVLRLLADLGVRYASVPAVVLTNFNLPDIRRMCSDVGAVAVLSKAQLSSQSLAQAIETALGFSHEARE